MNNRTRIVRGMTVLWAVTLPALANTFTYTSQAVPVGIATGGIGPGGGYDTSQLSIVDLTNGFKVTGILTITLPDLGFISAGYVQIYTQRYFDADPGTPAQLTAHVNGSFSTTGDAAVTQIGAFTMLNPTPSLFGACGAGAGVGTGQIGVPLPGGAFSASHTGNNVNPANPCVTVGTPTNILDQAFSLTFYYTHGGTITVDFGNSILSEGAADTSPVPEPAGGLLLGLAMAIGWCARQRREWRRQ